MPTPEMPTNPALTAQENYGNSLFAPVVTYIDDDDLADKLQAMADSMRGDKRLFFNKPGWMQIIGLNCCGGSPP